MLKKIVAHDLTVREVEDEVRLIVEGGKTPRKSDRKKAADEVLRAELRSAAGRVGTALGRRVSIRPDASGGGKMTLEYENARDLEALIEALCGKDFLS